MKNAVRGQQARSKTHIAAVYILMHMRTIQRVGNHFYCTMTTHFSFHVKVFMGSMLSFTNMKILTQAKFFTLDLQQKEKFRVPIKMRIDLGLILSMYITYCKLVSICAIYTHTKPILFEV